MITIVDRNHVAGYSKLKDLELMESQAIVATSISEEKIYKVFNSLKPIVQTNARIYYFDSNYIIVLPKNFSYKTEKSDTRNKKKVTDSNDLKSFIQELTRGLN